MENANTKDLWDAIKKMGNFSDSYYDQGIESDVKKELRLSKNDNLSKVQPELLFNAFFMAISPLSIMYEDILHLFEQCKANKSSKNIEIEFQSEKFSNTKFNIQHFIEARRKLEKVKTIGKRITINEEKMGNIWSLLQHNAYVDKRKIKNDSYNKWAGEYTNIENRWPETHLDFRELVDELPIRELLIKSFDCWQALLTFYRTTDRMKWRENIGKYSELEEKLLWNETDRCLLAILTSLYYFAERYSVLSSDEQKEIREQLAKFLEAFHVTNHYVEENMQAWKEFLRLPVWEKRHEVYSVWIFTKMIAAFPKEHITFHIQDETLVFPFSGACLATVTLRKETFAIWTELRTQAVVPPIGKSRKNAIQPDYSIVHGDENNIQNTDIVVECKQYKRASVKNFSEAIIDYGCNRPNAIVLLADYGEINQDRICAAVKGISRERYDVFSKCRPQNENVEKFVNTIRKVLMRDMEFFEIDSKLSMQFELTWDGEEKMQDYDLYMNLKKDSVLQEISYQKQNINGVIYSGDIQISPGREWIRVDVWDKGIYDVWVNNYTADLDFFEGNPIVTVKSKHMEKGMEIKPQKSGSKGQNWWHILTIDMRMNIGYVVNKMENERERQTE